MTDGHELTVEAAQTVIREGEVVGPTRQVIRLSTVAHVRVELARVYRDARHGVITTADAGRLAFVLTQTAKVIEAVDLEHRLRLLEGNHDAQL
jgi:hypothetical protein